MVNKCVTSILAYPEDSVKLKVTKPTSYIEQSEKSMEKDSADVTVEVYISIFQKL